MTVADLQKLTPPLFEKLLYKVGYTNVDSWEIIAIHDVTPNYAKRRTH
jgi:hypothetical protein